MQNVAQASNPPCTDCVSDARATLDGWRAQGADRLDPVGFATLDALEKRAQALTGAARDVLDARIATRLAAYAQQIEAQGNASATAQDTSANNAFAALIEAMSREARDGAPGALLDYFRDVWQKVSADQQVQQSLDQVPKNAGPLNSSSLVHRALFLMRDLSPGYLRQFLAYADGLAWLEDLNAAIAPPAAQAAQASATKKPRRTRAR
ncbi:DUF2894 domain-containing protein [Burkholderia sp. Ax-1719]|nr:DUF2894 domain-containing protein [Burkholderia sp. Ax-1719]NIE68276.1 DUF2894 domain-containing protein [Burkholderia sp. Ax-1719]